MRLIWTIFFFELTQAAAQLRQLRHDRGVALPLRMAGKGIDAGIAARCAHAGRNRRTAGDVYIVGQNEMAGNNCRPANGTTPPAGGGTRASDNGGYRGVSRQNGWYGKSGEGCVGLGWSGS